MADDNSLENWSDDGIYCAWTKVLFSTLADKICIQFLKNYVLLILQTKTIHIYFSIMSKVSYSFYDSFHLYSLYTNHFSGPGRAIGQVLVCVWVWTISFE